MDLSSTNTPAPLLERVAAFENLYEAFKMCSRGKRKTIEYQRFFRFHGEKLKAIEAELKMTGQINWGKYREFYVHDPKKRLVMAAPFKDRIVHAAIWKVVDPIVDKKLGVRSYACRFGMGNRAAVIRLLEQVRLMGKQRYCMKLDVKKYFYSINHEKLQCKLQAVLPDKSANHLLHGLIKSNLEFSEMGQGIPIGNLTSQLFANFYLSSMDQLACKLLNINFLKDEKEPHALYIRYMDDMVILTESKAFTLKVANILVEYAHDVLKLNIPFNKRILLSNDPIPFLGFVLDCNGHRVLSRNERRLTKKLKRLTKQGAGLADKAQVIQSYEAWKDIKFKV